MSEIIDSLIWRQCTKQWLQFSFGGLVCHEHPINLDCWANKQGVKIQKTAISKCLQCGCFVLQINESEREREFPSLFRFFQVGSDVFRCFPMFPHAFQYFQMFSDAFPMPGSSRDVKTNAFWGVTTSFPMPFRCLSDAFPMCFRCFWWHFGCLQCAFRCFQCFSVFTECPLFLMFRMPDCKDL